MNILCAGMRRSGSTWLYNATRMICAQHGSVYGMFADHHRLPNAGEYDYVIRKVHAHKKRYAKWADVVLTSHRDLRDVAASAYRRSLWRHTKDVIGYLDQAAYREYAKWGKVAAWNMCYERMIQDPVGRVAHLALVLGLPCYDPRLIREELDELTGPREGVDQATQMNAHHRTSDGQHGRYRQTLSLDLIRAIEKHFGRWLRYHGYELEAR
jgi:hypothetical protein